VYEMEVFLMHPHRAFNLGPLPAGAEAVRRDMELDVLLEAMGGDDGLRRAVCENALLVGLSDPRERSIGSASWATALHIPRLYGRSTT
jgi:hypothetical protein